MLCNRRLFCLWTEKQSRLIFSLIVDEDEDGWDSIELVPNIILNPGFCESDDHDTPYTRTIIFGEDDESDGYDDEEEEKISFKRKVSIFFTGDTIRRIWEYKKLYTETTYAAGTVAMKTISTLLKYCYREFGEKKDKICNDFSHYYECYSIFLSFCDEIEKRQSLCIVVSLFNCYLCLLLSYVLIIVNNVQKKLKSIFSEKGLVRNTAVFHDFVKNLFLRTDFVHLIGECSENFAMPPVFL